jgi:choice-of-anchor C domain-containing protein
VKILRQLASVASLSLISCAVLAAPVNLIKNGDFEMDDPDVSSGGYTKVAAGQNTINFWTVGGTSVDLIEDRFGHIDNVSVDLAGTPGPGSISQSFSVVAGQTYELVFDYFRNPPGTSLTVGFGSLDPITLGVAASIVRNQSYRWTATSNGQASVSFRSGGGNWGPTIDNVRVHAVPAPHSLALAGLALAGLVAVSRRSR